jgi:hypothetical protein
MTTSRTITVGWLALRLVSAEYNPRDAERQVEGLLTSLFTDGWNGWSFLQNHHGAIAIDVYQALESPAAVAALHRAGFTDVRIHEHERSRFVTCACRTHEAPPP